MKQLCLITLCLLAWAAPAMAGDFDSEIAQARKGLEAKDPAIALPALRRALAAAWKDLPFTALQAHLVADQPQGFGRYQIRKDNVFRGGEPVILYLEPVGYRVIRDKQNGEFFYNLTADFNLVDAWGRVMSGRRDFAQFQAHTRHFPDQVPLTFTYNINGLPPGDYRLETVLKDVLGNKSHTVITAVKVVVGN